MLTANKYLQTGIVFKSGNEDTAGNAVLKTYNNGLKKGINQSA